MASPVAVTIIAGFLGTGKTTLLNNVLQNNHGIRYAVLVNDFGELAIDKALITRHDGDTISFANGCVCCSLGDNLVNTIDELLERTPPIEQFLIETSGVANPKVLADVATLHPGLQRDLIITVCDAETLIARRQDPRLSSTVDMQLAPADVIILNKCDLANAQQQADAAQWLQENCAAPVVRTSHCNVPKDMLEANPRTDNTPVNDYDHNPHTVFMKASLDLSDVTSHQTVLEILKKYQHDLIRAKGFVFDEETRQMQTVQLSGNRISLVAAEATSMAAPSMVLLSLENLEPVVAELLKIGAMQVTDG